MIDQYIKAYDALQQIQTKHVKSFSWMAIGFGLVLVFAWLIVGSAMGASWWMLEVGVAILILLFGFAVGSLLVTGAVRGFMLGGRFWGQLKAHMEHARKLESEKIAAARLPPAPALPPAAENRLIPHSINGRAGELAVNLIDDWLDPRDAEWFAEYLAKGNKWTEAMLEKMPLHHTGGTFGRDKEGTPYRKLMDKCVAQGIIIERGGDGNFTGKLAIKEEKEIARRLKN